MEPLATVTLTTTTTTTTTTTLCLVESETGLLVCPSFCIPDKKKHSPSGASTRCNVTILEAFKLIPFYIKIQA
jgi:hypothetical protein